MKEIQNIQISPVVNGWMISVIPKHSAIVHLVPGANESIEPDFFIASTLSEALKIAEEQFTVNGYLR